MIHVASNLLVWTEISNHFPEYNVHGVSFAVLSQVILNVCFRGCYSPVPFLLQSAAIWFVLSHWNPSRWCRAVLFLRCLYDRAPTLSTFPSRSLDLWGPLKSRSSSRTFLCGICWTLQASDRVRSGEWRRNRPYAVVLHVHIEFLVASNTSEHHEPLHYSVQFRALIVVCTVPLMCVGLLRRRIIDRKWA